MLNEHMVWIGLSVFAVVVLVYGFWRSRGDGKPDPIRESGPIL
jgi:cytochrome oxidase assembly protein ShyY1